LALAPAQKPPQAGAQLEEVFEVGVGKPGHGSKLKGAVSLLLRYRGTIALSCTWRSRS
jgi:hypothetical protein